MRAILVATLLSAFVSSSASAQQGVPRSILARSGSSGVVIADAPIFLLPDATRVPLRVAAKGTTLVLVQDGPEWIQVQFQDPQLGLRQGYIQAKYLQRESLTPMDLSVPGAKPLASSGAERLDQVDQRGGQQPRPLIPAGVDAPGRQPMPRSGFWFSAGMGYGALTCDGCENSYLGGLSGGLAAGGTVNRHLLVGVGTTGWTRSIDGVDIAAGTFDFRVRAYPSLYHGFFVNGGIGVGSMTISVGSLEESENGLGIMYGVGWDIKTGRNVSVTPFWNGSALSAFDEVWGFGQIGVGITIH